MGVGWSVDHCVIEGAELALAAFVEAYVQLIGSVTARAPRLKLNAARSNTAQDTVY